MMKDLGKKSPAPIHTKLLDMQESMTQEILSIKSRLTDITWELQSIKAQMSSPVPADDPYVSTGNTIDANGTCVVKTSCIDNSFSYTGGHFLWVIDSQSEDPITTQAKQGHLPVDGKLKDLFNNPGVFIDIGANIGCVSLFLAMQGWKGYAFEAAKYNASGLEKTAVLNGFDMNVYPIAVMEQSGTICFASDGPWGMVQNDIISEHPYDTIPCVSMDDWRKTTSDTPIDFIKIDIEGSEVSALRGMKELLQQNKNPPILIEMNAYALCLQNETQKSLLALAHEYGYIPYEFIDGQLCKYDRERIPSSFISDFLLLSENRSIIKMPISEQGIIATKETTLHQVIDSLSLSEQWNLKQYGREEKGAEEYGAYICFALKDYPDIYSNPTVNAMLQQIKERNQDNLFLQKALSWLPMNTEGNP